MELLLLFGCSSSCIEWPARLCSRDKKYYQKRRDVLINSMARAGWNIPSPKASMFAWAPIPTKYKDKGSRVQRN